jgi:hypothetical protein
MEKLFDFRLVFEPSSYSSVEVVSVFYSFLRGVFHFIISLHVFFFAAAQV